MRDPGTPKLRITAEVSTPGESEKMRSITIVFTSNVRARRSRVTCPLPFRGPLPKRFAEFVKTYIGWQVGVVLIHDSAYPEVRTYSYLTPPTRVKVNLVVDESFARRDFEKVIEGALGEVEWVGVGGVKVYGLASSYEFSVSHRLLRPLLRNRSRPVAVLRLGPPPSESRTYQVGQHHALEANENVFIWSFVSASQVTASQSNLLGLYLRVRSVRRDFLSSLPLGPEGPYLPLTRGSQREGVEGRAIYLGDRHGF